MPRSRPRPPVRPALLAAPLALGLLCGCPGNPNEPGGTPAAAARGQGGGLQGDTGPIMTPDSSASPAGAPPNSGSPVVDRPGVGNAPSTGVANPADSARGVSPPG
jgi:hypothetical protein